MIMENDRKINPLLIVYVQQDSDNYRLARFNGLDHLRASLKEHGVQIGRGVVIGRETLIADGVSIGGGTVISPEATIERGAVIGRNCRIGHDAFIGRDTVLGDGVVVGDSAEIGRKSVVADCCVLDGGCIVQDNVQVGFASQLRPMSYVGSRSILGHHTVIGAGARLGQMVLTSPHTEVDSNRVVNSFTAVSGTGRDLHPDEELRRHYARREWPVAIGGEKAVAGTPDITQVPVQQPRKALGY